MAKKLVLVGGGHAHMVTLGNIHAFTEKGYSVTVIGPSEYHYYSGMGPGMLGKTYSPNDIRFATRKVVESQGGKFILDAAESIDTASRKVALKSGGTVPYDVLSVNAGSYVPNDLVTDDRGDIFSVKPIEKLLMAQKRIIDLCHEQQIRVGIVGHCTRNPIIMMMKAAYCGCLSLAYGPVRAIVESR